ncbi:4-(cytidine 5'-diphospho)-2-C-methyl-D-erythritol kinase [Ferrovum myxofaciens]|jgi:4-diphosphocytidyl-2-C-methyl-D-erythritol kinase|uniref:4-diphosphocytidyl-2-C-methyl-D-erythritol kinase n=2 Tax=root TaxID=1 RepID=A0A149W1U7_9PROT|nr:4-(cytidine 5'-diphospho)-2-C-methyl-D-erythritol kinase [Ferrovum myxofaciens]KXW59418.1 4-diphosphocytidyl-2-C-methyl-D-erythritol kinase [Ferrovum myxofaciens]QKE40799.1 MAG: 4-(cytidine 5'-diphospho)-2-C-methyl-D-erythritol kinase [Ferrovum myxofaciens]
MNGGRKSEGAWWQAPAPAKLNLFLKVTGRRADGYHTLQTLFTFLDFGDTLDCEVLDSGRIERAEMIPGVPEVQDLTLKAARLLQEQAGVRLGARLRLHKRIPIGGGLGGGSSDAATTLLVLNQLWGIHWARARLARLGLELGADVPVFIGGESALAEGVGEALAPVPVPERWYVIGVPGVSVSTQAVFSSPDLTRNSLPVKIRDFSGRKIGNDLEPVVRRMHPEVARLLDWMGEFGVARMSGSGGCCFLDFLTCHEANQVLKRFPPEYRGFVARGRQGHPLCTTG